MVKLKQVSSETWLQEQGSPSGWVTAEYTMLPCAAEKRNAHEFLLNPPYAEGRLADLEANIVKNTLPECGRNVCIH